MLRLSSSGTYQVIKQLIIHPKTTQKELSEATNLSKGRVSQIIKWLEDKRLIEKSGRTLEVVHPVELVKMFVFTRSMANLNHIDMRIRVDDIGALMHRLTEKDVIFCGTTALTFYDMYCTRQELNFYCPREHLREIKQILREYPRGDVSIRAYEADFLQDHDINHLQRMRVTSEVRTLIDLACEHRLDEAKNLMEKMWITQYPKF